MQERFLRRFALAAPRWDELLPGRLARLTLNGADGSLHLFAAYFPTGIRHAISAAPSSPEHLAEESLRKQRMDLAELLRHHVRPREALSIVAGDFNFVMSPEDRLTKATGEFSGHRDAGEARHWQRLFGSSEVLYDLWQPAATHDGPLSRARLDRVYVSQPLCDQLDKLPYSSPLAWCPHLSQHRPLAFGRLSRQVEKGQARPVDERVIRQPSWSLRVSAAYHERLRTGWDGSRFHKLALLKAAIREVSDRMFGELRAQHGAACVEDGLGAVMSALRRLERNRWIWVASSTMQCPRIGQVVSQQLVDSDPGAAAAALRELAVALAREDLRRDLEQLQADLPDLAPEVSERRRGHLLRKVRKLAPGKSAAVDALEAPDGSVQAAPAEVASILCNHWGDVFSKRHLRPADIRAWLQADCGADDGLAAALRPLVADPSNWQIRRQDVEAAIARTSRSAPGPDGIPYSAWRALGPLGVEVLYDVAQELEGAEGRAALLGTFPLDASGQTDFNAAVMIFIPKKQLLISDSGIEYTRAADLRPLSIVNTDNRLVANAMRLRIEPLLEQAISQWQQGFLPGRSLLRNVVNVDARMREVAYLAEDPAAIFYDFEAAFPSLAHDFLHQSLLALGLPESVCRFVECLYLGHGCKVSSSDGLHPGFRIEAGIRQGCPLSPLLFAVVVDPLLRRLQREICPAEIRAYADDLVTVLWDLWKALPSLVELFAGFAAASGLRLNFAKVVLVPLGDASSAAWSSRLMSSFPTWSRLQCRGWAEYLGFVLGPECADRGWAKALAKCVTRAHMWGQLALGLQFAAVVYRVYIASTLGFLLQLDDLPDTWPGTEAQILRTLVHGPYLWLTARDLHGLRRDFGFPQEFVDVREVGLAAKYRVTKCEGCRSGGLGHRIWLRTLAAAERASVQLLRLGRWRAWFHSSFCHKLEQAVAAVRQAGISETQARELAAGYSRLGTQQQKRRADGGLQRAVHSLLREGTRRAPEMRMRQKLEAWQMPLFPRHRATRATAMLNRLTALVAPRVSAAVLRTLWSGWCTQRRFGGRARCLFCAREDEDSVEHASVCKSLATFGHAELRLPYFAEPGQRRINFLLLDPASALSDAALTLGALRVAAAYHCHCRFRRRPDSLRGSEGVRRALLQLVKELVQGHVRSLAVFDGRWVQSC